MNDILTLDDSDLSEFDLMVLADHDNPLLPGTRDNLLEVPGMHGAHDMGSIMGTKPFNIPMGIRPQKSYADLRYKADQFTKFILDPYGHPREIKLMYNYNPDRYYMVKYSGQLPIQRLVSMGKFNLPLRAANPMAQSKVLTHEINWDSEKVTMDDSYLFGTVAVEDVQIKSNQTVQAWANWYAVRPTILITGSGSNVTFSANGKSFSLKNFSNATFEIKGDTYTVTKNGANGFSQKVGKQFLDLLPGLNDVQITGDNMDFTLSIRVRDQHM
ncbi:Phage-related protein [Virgibacillus subterraneus]|uniref:Phage-related protein n=1 Tax=Virgibacillus subterraneus TaxID=621109 RepID=A0A1H9EEX2_9BACI|nr:phage tail domain-containing protein [Virgibacillus subterraneus]SEQ23803.1 Phage-related protein [Virgibacillus subterraneus]